MMKGTDGWFLFELFWFRTCAFAVVPQGSTHERKKDPDAAEHDKEGETNTDAHENMRRNIGGNHDRADKEGDDHQRNTNR